MRITIDSLVLDHRTFNTEEWKALSHVMEECKQKGTNELRLEGSLNKQKNWNGFHHFWLSDKKIGYKEAVALSETLKTNTTWNTIVLNRLTNDDTQRQKWAQ